MKTRLPSDAIRVILCEAYRPANVVKFDELDLHLIVYAHREHPLFESFSFNTSGTSPYSEMIGDTLMRMRIARVISPGFDGGTYIASETYSYVDKEIKPLFDTDELLLLMQMGRDLRMATSKPFYSITAIE